MWSFVNKTSVLTSYEDNEFTANYIQRSSTIQFPLSIDFVKGWINQPGNIQLVISNLERWITITKMEMERVSSTEFKEMNKSNLYPDQDWLSQEWLVEVCKAQEMNKKMYENALNGDMWDFCEFHFGKHFIRLFLERMQHAIHFVSKKYRKHSDMIKTHKKPNFINSRKRVTRFTETVE